MLEIIVHYSHYFFYLVILSISCYLIGFIRVGTRRNTKPIPDHVLSTKSCRVAETGLIQQWYTDQPVQRIYALVICGNWSEQGLSLLKDAERVKRAIKALIARHPALATSLYRDPKSNRAYIVTRDSNNIEDSMGSLPITWFTRKNEGTWRDCYHQLTHSEMNESKWLFRFGFVLSNDGKGEIILATHHVITDGMSSFNVIKDFFAFLSTDDSSILPALPYLVMDEVIDLRPPISLIVEALGDDLIPSSLSSATSFYQGPKLSPPTIPFVEGHLATIHIPPKIFQKLASIAKAKRISINGLLGSLMLLAQTKTIQDLDHSKSASSSIKLKFSYPNGKSCRDVGHISSEQVGVYITSQDLLFDIPTQSTSSSTTTTTNSSSLVWDIAQTITNSAKKGPRESLDKLGLLNFLPRDSITPWFLKEGRRYILNRNGSLEISNLGNVDLVHHQNHHHHQHQLNKDTSAVIREEVTKMFDEKDSSSSSMEVLLCQGQAIMSSVFMVGVATIHQHLTISINCQWGQCGCQESIKSQNKNPRFYEDYVGSLQKKNDSQENGYMICACPKDKLLYCYTTNVHEELLSFASSHHD